MGILEVVKSLLRKDSSIGFRIDKKGQTALHMAVKGQTVDIVLELSKPDPSVLNLEDNKGNTALHIATKKGKAENMPPHNARGRDRSLMGSHGARGIRVERDDENHQESVMGGGASAPGGNVGGAPPTFLGGAEFMQRVFTIIEQVVRNMVHTMQVPIRTADSRATAAMKAFLQLHSLANRIRWLQQIFLNKSQGH
ncbi:uncharacterized protein LOC130783421 isoform X7 [Actinidia eriantha]|uniref:uncharacterized protein LOC130783421 isoform X7 n=1 Tax=Actinidia eriantha TaxID=165200 RepID=UPI0025859775|nr:uncharacterized protein LOC130783421 isoform X7 [Actinidia eriantha]